MARHPHSSGSQPQLHFRINWRAFKIPDVQAASKSESLGMRFRYQSFLKLPGGASLVAQWLRVCLPMQETRVRALVWEDPTCRGATKPVSHNY